MSCCHRVDWNRGCWVHSDVHLEWNRDSEWNWNGNMGMSHLQLMGRDLDVEWSNRTEGGREDSASHCPQQIWSPEEHWMLPPVAQLAAPSPPQLEACP